MTDYQTVKDLQGAQFASALGSNAAAQDVLAAQNDRVFFPYRHPADDAMASTATAETVICALSVPFKVKRISVRSDATITGHASNFATITFRLYTGAGVAIGTIATYTTDSGVSGQGTLTKWIVKTATLVDALVHAPAAAFVTMEITKSGSGVVVSKGLIVACRFENE